MVERSNGQKLKALHTENGGECSTRESENYLQKECIHHQHTVLKTPNQNVVAERMNRTLTEIVGTMLSDSNLLRFWAEALLTTTYIRNRIPTTAVQKWHHMNYGHTVNQT